VRRIWSLSPAYPKEQNPILTTTIKRITFNHIEIQHPRVAKYMFFSKTQFTKIGPEDKCQHISMNQYLCSSAEVPLPLELN
jgi:hypothetical protein